MNNETPLTVEEKREQFARKIMFLTKLKEIER